MSDQRLVSRFSFIHNVSYLEAEGGDGVVVAHDFADGYVVPKPAHDFVFGKVKDLRDFLLRDFLLHVAIGQQQPFLLCNDTIEQMNE